MYIISTRNNYIQVYRVKTRIVSLHHIYVQNDKNISLLLIFLKTK